MISLRRLLLPPLKKLNSIFQKSFWLLVSREVNFIEELHEHRIVYRDLKLDNIMIGADGHVRVRIGGKKI